MVTNIIIFITSLFLSTERALKGCVSLKPTSPVTSTFVGLLATAFQSSKPLAAVMPAQLHVRAQAAFWAASIAWWTLHSLVLTSGSGSDGWRSIAISHLLIYSRMKVYVQLSQEGREGYRYHPNSNSQSGAIPMPTYTHCAVIPEEGEKDSVHFRDYT